MIHKYYAIRIIITHFHPRYPVQSNQKSILILDGINLHSNARKEERLQERKDSQQVWNGKNTRIPRALISMRRGFFKPRIFSSSMNLRVENLIMTSQQAWSSKRIIRPRFPRYLLKINSFIFPRRREKRRKILWKNFAERERNYCCLFIAAG